MASPFTRENIRLSQVRPRTTSMKTDLKDCVTAPSPLAEIRSSEFLEGGSCRHGHTSPPPCPSLRNTHVNIKIPRQASAQQDYRIKCTRRAPMSSLSFNAPYSDTGRARSVPELARPYSHCMQCINVYASREVPPSLREGDERDGYRGMHSKALSRCARTITQKR